MRCERCERLHLGKGPICHACRKRKRRIHVILDSSEEESSSPKLERSSSEATSSNIEPEKPYDEEDFHVSFDLSEGSFGFGSPPPQPLSASAQGSSLSPEPLTPIFPCGSPEGMEEEEEEKGSVPLRVFYWNVERLGGIAQWGLPEQRAQEVIAAMARVIDEAAPHLVVLVEVMAHKGAQEVGRLLDALNVSGRQWRSCIPPQVTGCTQGKPGTGETYAVLYEKGAGIEPVWARMGQVVDGNGGTQPFPTGTYQDKDGNEVEFRAPAEFLFRMGGPFAVEEDGGTWPLAIVAFHAPGPQAKRERQAKIEELIARLGSLEVVADPESYPDCLICADLNSHPDAYNISKEPETTFDIAFHVWKRNEGGDMEGSDEEESDEEESDEEESDEEGSDEEGDESKELVSGGQWVLEKSSRIQEREARSALASSRKYGLREQGKVITRVKTRVAEVLGTREMEERWEVVEQQDLMEEAEHPRKRDVREWREEVDACLAQLEEFEAESSRKGLELIQRLNRAPREERERVWNEFGPALERYEKAREQLMESLKKLEPRIAGIQTIEDQRLIVEHIRRPGTLLRQRVAEIKRELTQEIKTHQEWEKFYYREQAYEPLDPAPKSTGDEQDEQDALGVFAREGFFNNLTYDSDLLTTRRRTITALRTKGKQGKLQLPTSAIDLQYSKYDQVLSRTLGHLRQPDNRVLPMLAAVLSSAAHQRLFSGEIEGADEDIAQGLIHQGLGIPRVGPQSPLAEVDFSRLPGLVHNVLKGTETWRQARAKTIPNIQFQQSKNNLPPEQQDILLSHGGSPDKLEEADPPNFHALQLGLHLARALSDHDPMLVGFWVHKTQGHAPASSPSQESSGTQTLRYVPPEAGTDCLAALGSLEGELYRELRNGEGGAHPLVELIHGFLCKKINALGLDLVSQRDAVTFLGSRVNTLYAVAGNLLNGSLGDTFNNEPGGVENPGNTCYLAAVLQTLAAEPFYRRQLARQVHEDAAAAQLRAVLTLAIRLINNSQIISFDVTELVRWALIASEWPSGAGEQDPADLLLHIANKLTFDKPVILHLKTLRNDTPSDQVSWVPTPEHLIPLAIPQNGSDDTSLGACLKAFLDEDLNEDERGEDKRIQLLRKCEFPPPGVAVLQMKRYNSNGSRLNTRLSGMEKIVADSGSIPLTTVIRHIGEQLTTGHYHAYVCRNGRFFCCNDSTVAITDPAQLDDAIREGYVFFYNVAPAAQ
jgi:hypothetical protein